MRRVALSRKRNKAAGLVAAALAALNPSALLAQSVQLGASGGISSEGATTEGSADAAQPEAQTQAPKPAERDPERDRRREMRAANTYYGPVGGIFVVDAGSGAPKSFRLQLMTDLFVKKDFLYKGDKNRYTGGVLSLGVTPIRNLELNAAISTRSNRNSRTEPEVLQAVGDLHFGFKAFGEVTDGVMLGGDAQLSVLSALDNVGTNSAATTVGLRGNLSLDLRKMTTREVPLQLRFNAAYVFNNSDKLIRDTERARLRNLSAQGNAEIDPVNEYRHLVRRDERFALGIDRVDHVALAVGAEAPIEVSKRVAIHPIAEWGIELPVNRQGFDCPYVETAGGSKLGGTDSCVGREKFDAWRQRITVGARIFPVLEGLNLLAAVDIGVGGSTNFVQELAPNSLYRIMLSASYAADLMPKPEKVKVVENRVEVQVPVAPPEGRIQGLVVEQGNTDVGVPGATIGFPGRGLNAILGNPDGSFLTYAVEPGDVQLEIEAEGYRPGTCGAAIPTEGGNVTLTCELVALPRVGSVVGQVVLGSDGSPVSGLALMLSGPVARSIVTDEAGRFQQQDLPPGDYTARIEQDGYLISVTPFQIKVRSESELRIPVLATPKASSVKVQKDRIQIRGSIFFTSGTAELEARSEPLLTEIADVIMRNADLLTVEIQGHTDDTGTPDQNLALSQKRAEAVRDWLIKAGVERDRLVARGLGSDQPIVPNVTTQNRAKNRRVEFVIASRAGQ